MTGQDGPKIKIYMKIMKSKNCVPLDTINHRMVHSQKSMQHKKGKKQSGPE